MEVREYGSEEELGKEKIKSKEHDVSNLNDDSILSDRTDSNINEQYISMRESVFSSRHQNFRRNGILCVAPMMEWTDRHFRYMMRKITKETLLYTEMVVDSTLLHQTSRLNYFLGHHIEERPLAVQLGGSDPKDVSEAAYICESFGGFESINLNCGCPSKKVSKRCFGARLMLDPEKVARITYEMLRKTSMTPITVKCRIGADNLDQYEDLVNFIHTVSRTGVREFIIHARKCFLNGLSASQNRSIPPLQYPLVHRLAREFPELYFTINGGIASLDQAKQHLRLDNQNIEITDHIQNEVKDSFLSMKESCGNETVSNIDDDIGEPSMYGVMIGRSAYNNPWQFRNADSMFYNKTDQQKSRREIIEEYLDYAENILDIARDQSNSNETNTGNNNNCLGETEYDKCQIQEEDEEEAYYNEVNEHRKVKEILSNVDGKTKTLKYSRHLSKADIVTTEIKQAWIGKNANAQVFGASPTYLIKPLHFLFNGIPYSHDFKRHLAKQVDWQQVKRDQIPLTDIVFDAMGNLWKSPLLDEI